MNLLRIQYFLQLCETLHFTEAARTLNISQPALTKAIGQLENELGTRLIRREGKHTHLTHHGDAARRKYTDLMRLVSVVEKDVKNIVNGEDEKIKIAVSQTLDFSMLAQFLVQFHTKHPNVYMDVIGCNPLECEELLISGSVDIVFTNDCQALYDRLICIELYENNLIIMSSNNTYEVSTQFLDNHSQPDGHTSATAHPTKIFSHTEDSRCIAHCSQLLWTQQLIDAGLGFGLLPACGVTTNDENTSTKETVVGKQTIYAAIPVGRSDESSFNQFVKLLKKHDWKKSNQTC